METINWQEHEEKGTWNRPNLVAYALIEAMVNKEPRDIPEIFKPFDPKNLSVEMKINGVEVSFIHVMNLIQSGVESLESEIRASIIKDAARELIEELSKKIDFWQ